MPTLIRKDTGQEVSVPQEMIEQALSSGHYIVDPEMEIVTRSDRGGYGRVRLGDVGRASEIFGHGVATESEVQAGTVERYLEEEFGDRPVRSVAKGILSGITFGLSDASEFSDTDPLGRRQAQEEYYRNKGWRTGGEIIGAVGTGVLSGGTGTIGRLARLTPTGKLAHSVSGLAGRGLGGAVAAAGIEGFVYGAGQTAARIAIEDEPLAAEAVISEIVKGGLFGAGTGAVLGGAGYGLYKLGEKGIARIGTKLDIPEVGEEFTTRVAQGGTHIVDAGDGLLADAAKVFDSGIDSKPLRDAVGVAESSKKNLIEALSADSAKAFDGDAMGISKVFSMSPKDGAKVVGAFDDYVKSLHGVDDILKTGRAESISVAAKEISDVILGKETAKAVTRTDLEAAAVAYGLQEYLLPDLDGPADEIVKALIAYKIATHKTLPVTKKMGAFGRAGTEATRRAFQRGAVMGGGSSQNTALGIMADQARWVAGGRIGAWLYGKGYQGVMGLRSEVSNAHNRVGEAMARSAMKTGKGVRRAGPSTAAILSNTSFGPEKPKKSKDKWEAYQARSQELATAVAGMPSTLQTIHDNLGFVRQMSMGVGDKAAGKAGEILRFLHEKMPKDPGNIRRLGKSIWKPSEDEVDKFARYVNAVQDPAGIVERFADGTLSFEDAEVLRTVYPAHFMQVQTWLMNNYDWLEKQDYEYRNKLFILTGVQTDPLQNLDWQKTFGEPDVQSPQQQTMQRPAKSIQPTMNQNLTGVRDNV